jgi:hypothetical protein
MTSQNNTKKNCNACKDLSKYIPQTYETIIDGCLIKTIYKCAKCRRIIYEDIE